MRAGVLSLGMVWVRFAVPALVAIAIMVTTERIVGTAPIVSKVAPTGIVWQGRVFPTRRDFDRWLVARRSSYAEWARAHPALAAPPSARRVAEARGLTAAAHDTSLGLRLLLLGIAAVTAIMFASGLPYSVERIRRLAARRPVRLALSPRGDPVVATGGSAAVTLGNGRSRPSRRAAPSSTPAAAPEVPRRRSIPRPAPSRARLRRPSLPGRGSARARRRTATPDPNLRRRYPWLQPVQVRLHRPSVFAGTPALPAYRYWIRTLRRRHPDLVWSIAAGALGAVVAILVALSMY